MELEGRNNDVVNFNWLRPGQLDTSFWQRIMVGGITDCLPPASAKPHGFQIQDFPLSMFITLALYVA